MRRGAAAGALSYGAWGGFWGLCNGSVVGCSALRTASGVGGEVMA